jgi:hypothetical protein
LRGFEWHYLERLCHSEIFSLKGHEGFVRAVAYSPDGRTLASAAPGISIRPTRTKRWKLSAARIGSRFTPSSAAMDTPRTMRKTWHRVFSSASWKGNQLSAPIRGAASFGHFCWERSNIFSLTLVEKPAPGNAAAESKSCPSKKRRRKSAINWNRWMTGRRTKFTSKAGRSRCSKLVWRACAKNFAPRARNGNSRCSRTSCLAKAMKGHTSRRRRN